MSCTKPVWIRPSDLFILNGYILKCLNLNHYIETGVSFYLQIYMIRFMNHETDTSPDEVEIDQGRKSTIILPRNEHG